VRARPAPRPEALRPAPQVVSSPGQPLALSVRRLLEPRFGYDFASVRVHADAAAARSSQELGAAAYTVGHHVVFGDRQFAPGSPAGLRLIAHELAHVVQQGGGPRPAGRGLRLSGAHDPAETEADRAADLATTRPGRVPRLTRASEPALHRAPARTPVPGARGLPAWTPAQLGAIQAQLKRIGLFQGTVDRRFGTDTESGLVEAFGGDEWRTLPPKTIISRLTAAKPPPGKRGEPNLRYGELFKDGMLDITLGVGFDEGGAGKATYNAIAAALPAEGFAENTAKAMEIYKRTGNTPGASAYGQYFVWKNVLTYTPPAGPARTIAVVLRVVTSRDDKHGAEAAGAFGEGLKHSDIAIYEGHGRFGTGPDFDPAMKVIFLNPDGTKRLELDDFEAVGPEIGREIKSKDVDAQWKYFLRQVAAGHIRVQGANRGNIYLNKTVKHAGEFGARLMYWNLGRPGGQGGTLETGRKGELARPGSERRYRLWVFNGCRTQDYEKSLRSTPGADPRSTDIVETQRTIYWNDYAKTFTAFLRAVLAQQSAAQIIKEMDATNTTARPRGAAGATYTSPGLADNPVIR
jgi:Domain of unknown function (DUF4157)